MLATERHHPPTQLAQVITAAFLGARALFFVLLLVGPGSVAIGLSTATELARLGIMRRYNMHHYIEGGKAR